RAGRWLRGLTRRRSGRLSALVLRIRLRRLRWDGSGRSSLRPRRAGRGRGRFGGCCFPTYGRLPFGRSPPPRLFPRCGGLGGVDVLRRAIGRSNARGRYSVTPIATGRAEHDITADLRDALTPTKTRHFAAITEPRRVGELRFAE